MFRSISSATKIFQLPILLLFFVVWFGGSTTGLIVLFLLETWESLKICPKIWEKNKSWVKEERKRHHVHVLDKREQRRLAFDKQFEEFKERVIQIISVEPQLRKRVSTPDVCLVHLLRKKPFHGGENRKRTKFLKWFQSLLVKKPKQKFHFQWYKGRKGKPWMIS